LELFWKISDKSTKKLLLKKIILVEMPHE
jgi:hypothetical protein